MMSSFFHGLTAIGFGPVGAILQRVVGTGSPINVSNGMGDLPEPGRWHVAYEDQVLTHLSRLDIGQAAEWITEKKLTVLIDDPVVKMSRIHRHVSPNDAQALVIKHEGEAKIMGKTGLIGKGVEIISEDDYSHDVFIDGEYVGHCFYRNGEPSGSASFGCVMSSQMTLRSMEDLKNIYTLVFGDTPLKTIVEDAQKAKENYERLYAEQHSTCDTERYNKLTGGLVTLAYKYAKTMTEIARARTCLDAGVSTMGELSKILNFYG